MHHPVENENPGARRIGGGRYALQGVSNFGWVGTRAAIALIADDVRLQFQSALASRDIIGQAKGMIMERFDVDAVRAFELLTRVSQDSNVRLATVAEKIVSRGAEPDF